LIAGKTILAIVPARGGSKRLPGKNIRNLVGEPLIARTIRTGLNSKYIDELIVSTDDLEIQKVSLQYGAKVPFLRPPELATDEASSFAVVEHVILTLKETFSQGEYDYIILLQPTSPLRDELDIDGAIEFLIKKEADAVISVCEMEHSPLWSNTLPEDLAMGLFLREEIKGKRSQELDKYYRLNGAIYVCQTRRLLEEKTFFLNDNLFAYIMPMEKSMDIDTLWDFKLCEALLSE